MTVSEVGREKVPYRDPARTVDERVDDLLGRLTLEEKVAQLGSRWVWELADDQGRLRPEANGLLRHGLGQVTRVAGASGLGPEQVAELANTLQRTLVEETRLGIPAIVHEEICSGLMARDATVFPQAIGLASTWEPALIEEVAEGVQHGPVTRPSGGATQRAEKGLQEGGFRTGSARGRAVGAAIRLRRDARWRPSQATRRQSACMRTRLKAAKAWASSLNAPATPPATSSSAAAGSSAPSARPS